MIDSDREAVRAVRRGDRDAFGELVQRYEHRLFGLVLMMVRTRAPAEEIAQDAFVRAYTHLDRYNERRPFYPWLATIAVHLAQNWLQRQAPQLRCEGVTLDGAHEPQIAADALNDLLADESSRRLWRAVASLSSGERTAAVLFYRDELSVADIARALGVTSGTIKTLLFRARRNLRERLSVPRKETST